MRDRIWRKVKSLWNFIKELHTAQFLLCKYSVYWFGSLYWFEQTLIYIYAISLHMNPYILAVFINTTLFFANSSIRKRVIHFYVYYLIPQNYNKYLPPGGRRITFKNCERKRNAVIFFILSHAADCFFFYKLQTTECYSQAAVLRYCVKDMLFKIPT